MAIDPDKYIVFKREDLERVWHNTYPAELKSLALDDAVVFRLQDEFCAPALDVYSAILNAAARVHPQVKPAKHFREIANYFQEKAEESRHDVYTKLPD